jgi:light-independent protochlorophyllide reductase subunit B
MGFEGANVIFDTWVHPLMMGLEEHLLHMFRDDFEFNEKAAPSHLGHQKQEEAVTEAAQPITISWLPDAEAELKKIPFFVRKKARSNTESFAAMRGLSNITIETLYDAKAHFSR